MDTRINPIKPLPSVGERAKKMCLTRKSWSGGTVRRRRYGWHKRLLCDALQHIKCSFLDRSARNGLQGRFIPQRLIRQPCQPRLLSLKEPLHKLRIEAPLAEFRIGKDFS